MAAAAGDGALRVNAVLDFPDKSALVTVKGTATFGELKRLLRDALLGDAADAKENIPVAAAAGAGAGALAGYQLNAVWFGAAGPKELTGAADTATLSALGLPDLTTLVLCAPAALKPKRVRAAKLRAADDDEGEGKAKAAAASDADAYKGLTAKNVLQKWSEAEAGSRKKKVAFEYIEMYGSEVLKSPAFVELKRDAVKAVVSSDRLSVDAEVDVFDAVVRWGEKQVAAAAAAGGGAGKDAKSGDALRDALGDVLHCVRFPLLAMNDLAMKVAATGLLSQDQTLGLFTYLGQKQALGKDDDGKKALSLTLHESLKPFTRRPRDGRPPLNAMEWDTEWKSAGIAFEDKNKLAVKAGQETQSYIIANRKRPLKGRVSWHIKIETVGHWVFLGVGSDQYTGYMHNTAWGWASSNQRYESGRNTNAYGDQCTFAAGTTVHFTFDEKANTLAMREGDHGVERVIQNLPKGNQWFAVADPYNANVRLRFVDK